ncbi:MAG TPA: NAD+ synthase [Kineosporiaceae bacterium]|nr:NAD+ synthase [Kineosporiaceae bacterium]
MPQLRLALAQINPTVGDLAGNAALIRSWTARAAAAGAHLVAFPEMVLTGYPVEDLTLRSSFVEASRAAVRQLAADLAADGFGELPVVVGYLDHAEHQSAHDGSSERGGEHAQQDRDADGTPKGAPQNCAAVLHGGAVVARYAKHHLPNYGVFDEFRIFVPGRDLTLVRVQGIDVQLAICEDIWQEGGPVAAAREAGAGLLLVINGSPYERDKDDTRKTLVARRAGQAGCPVAYVNLVGGQDDLVFDGDSIVVGQDGEVIARAPQFDDALLIADLDLAAGSTTGPSTTIATSSRPSDEASIPDVQHVVLSDRPVSPYPPQPGTIADPLDGVAEVYRALVVALRDYVRKNGFRSVVLGLSGGIDSALVATIAADSIGGEHVFGVSMPSGYSSEHSKDDAADLAKRIGADYRVVPIAPMVQAFLDSLGLTGIAEENLQARVRGVVLMGLSNQDGHLTLTTGNKSELAVGYSTIYGDSVGGYNPLKDVPKTLVWALARWRNAQAVELGEVPPIPENSISKPPSAELRPGQTDQDSLPPYDLLDDLLQAYVERAQGRSELIDSGYQPETVDGVVTMVDRAEWKRRQSAPGPKISPVAFGRDRRLPITSRWREHES